MNRKDLYLFNTVKSVQFLKSFRPSSTPLNDFASPGLSNINIHSFLVKSCESPSNVVYKKETLEENKKTEFDNFAILILFNTRIRTFSF